MLADQKRGGLKECAGHVAALPCLTALVQRGQNGNHTEHAASNVDDRRARPKRPVRKARHVGESTHHLGHFIQSHPILIGP